MTGSKKKYVTPVIAEVKFEDKNLVTFGVCSKQAKVEGDSASCCDVLPDHEPNATPYDPS